MASTKPDFLFSARRQRLGCRAVSSGVRRVGKITAIGLSAVLLFPAIGWTQDSPDFFRQNCMNCHTIGGGRLTGPDLKDVSQRKDREWLIGFMMNPKAYIDSG